MRLLVDKRSWRNAGKGKAIPSSLISLKWGAEPPKNALPTSIDGPEGASTVIRMLSSAWHGFCITLTIDSSVELVTWRSISHRRSGRRSATMTFLGICFDFRLALNFATRGRVGQEARILPIGAPYSQRIRRSRRRGDVEITCRHFRQTCARRCHFHGPRDCLMASSR
jgi:hypothetical protein